MTAVVHAAHRFDVGNTPHTSHLFEPTPVAAMAEELPSMTVSMSASAAVELRTMSGGNALVTCPSIADV
jgi:hypothetical protein